jgi:uncharacterized protein
MRIGAGMGLGGLVVIAALALLMGQNPLDVIGQVLGGASDQVAGAPPTQEELAAQEEEVQFVSFVLDDAQQFWKSAFAQQGSTYPDAKLVLFRDAIESACGFAQAAMGPFYCPGDQKVYIDLGFYNELKQRFGADGDFAQAYVIAHELGHHIQRITGIETKARAAQQNDPANQNQISVQLELQADCLAGVWGHSAAQRNLLDTGDAAEALNAASAIGDDRIQRETTGRVSPESFTHGSSEQRVRSFRQGFDSGNLESCNSF